MTERQDLPDALIADVSMVEKIFVEPVFGDDCPIDPFSVSDAASLLAYLRVANLSAKTTERQAYVG